MFELEEFEKSVREQRRERGSIRKALEDGKLRPVPMQLPKLAEHKRRRRRYGKENSCGVVTKAGISVVVFTLIAMLCYALWRIRDIEMPSEMREYEYRVVRTEEINDAGDDTVDAT